MATDNNGNSAWIVYFLALILMATYLNPNSGRTGPLLSDIYVLKTQNGEHVFLGMAENEIKHRLGEPQQVVSSEDQTTYVYDGMSLMCSDFAVVKIKISNPKYSTLNGLKPGDLVFDVGVVNGFVVPLWTHISKEYAERTLTAELEGQNQVDRILIYSHDPFGKDPYRSGQRVDSKLPTFVVNIELVKNNISAIVLETTRIAYGNL